MVKIKVPVNVDGEGMVHAHQHEDHVSLHAVHMGPCYNLVLGIRL